MRFLRHVIVKGILLGVLTAGVGAGALLAYVTWYTHHERILPGVVAGPVQLGGLSPGEAAHRLREASGVGEAEPTLPQSADLGGTAPEEGSVRLRWRDRAWGLSWQESMAGPDLVGAVSSAVAIGRSGPALERTRTFVSGLMHGHVVPLERRLNEGSLRLRLAAIAKEVDTQPRDARYDPETDTVVPEEPGRRLQIEESLKAVRAAVLAHAPEVELKVAAVSPTVTAAELAETRRTVLARFRTPILAADSGRVHNITMAVKRISGLFLKPGQVFSFNEEVGPRDAAHGWAQAKELYQGEFVLGYGGGICQVSSTLYNSVLLGGLEVRQRFHHDRPLQYVSPGRDATVAYNALDFKFRNSLSVPIMLGARVISGSPQQIEVSVYAPAVPAGAQIDLEESDVRYFPPPMEEILDPTLPAGDRVVVDEGHYGIEVKIYRTFKEGSVQRRELVSHDRYLPKTGKVRVGVGNAPGAGKLLDPGLQ